MIKQVIVVREDLKMNAGKTAAQVSHACMKLFFDRMKRIPFSFPEGNSSKQMFKCQFTPAMLEWLEWELGKEGFTKIVLGCNSEQELYDIENKANEAGIPNALIIDSGHTQLNEVHTPTCICLGPDEDSKIDPITGNYKLLRK